MSGNKLDLSASYSDFIKTFVVYIPFMPRTVLLNSVLFCGYNVERNELRQ